MHAAITRPLARGDRAQRRWFDGTSSDRALARLVKPSRTLRPVERVEIYNRMYWFRLLDSLAQDFPALRAHLGEQRFWDLAERYLAAHPSRSFTLRNLGRRLPRFLRAHPELVHPDGPAAVDLARFEWAQVVAFDGLERPPLEPTALAAADPATVRIGLQPYVTLLAVRHPVDDFVIRLKQEERLRSAASNATQETLEPQRNHEPLAPCPVLDLAVHRVANQLYYKRLAPEAALLLRRLRAGHSLADACSVAFRASRIDPELQSQLVRDWFSTWTRLGWLCAA
ncbi:DUF2063 domain-containing protein [Opitutaceae bacterium EW11]|nr:DUF2063 domain-containing protein [Opitutaceae bacterium EW11]